MSVPILGSEIQMLESRHTGRTYRITISLPLGYHAAPDEAWPFNAQPEKWSTVYVLDGNWYFGMVTDMIRPTAWCGSITDAIVVGIGYGEDPNPVAAFRESFMRRNTDLTPVRDEAVDKELEAYHKQPVPTGDGVNFHKFIRDELIPFIETTYRADPAKRILVGHSYGGLFGLYGLFETPDLFRSLILGSPTLSYGNRMMFAREAEFAAKPRPIPANVYLFVGDLEENLTDQTMTDTLRLAAILQGRGYEGFAVKKQVFADQNHCEVAAPGSQWGLKSALRK